MTALTHTLAPGEDATLEEIRQWAVARALIVEHGQKPRAAKRLGISLKTLYNWLNKEAHSATRTSGGLSGESGDAVGGAAWAGDQRGPECLPQ